MEPAKWKLWVSLSGKVTVLMLLMLTAVVVIVELKMSDAGVVVVNDEVEKGGCR